jgi:hypothetical protein
VSSVTGETWTQTGSTTVAIQGTYFGQLTPGTPIRVRCTYDGTTYDVHLVRGGYPDGSCEYAYKEDGDAADEYRGHDLPNRLRRPILRP